MKPLLLCHLFIFFMLQLHERRQDYCVLSLNLCNLLQFALIKTFRFAYALIITKKFSPSPFLFLAAPVLPISCDNKLKVGSLIDTSKRILKLKIRQQLKIFQCFTKRDSRDASNKIDFLETEFIVSTGQ